MHKMAGWQNEFFYKAGVYISGGKLGQENKLTDSLF
jgi:hypothetical protein